MNVEKLLEKLCKDVANQIGLPWLDGYTDHGSLRSGGDPKGEIRTHQAGQFLSVIIQISMSGTTSDRTTDRAGGDPYYAVVRYDWIGIVESAPKEVSQLEELNEWSLLNTHYVMENTDAGLWCVHDGSFVAGLEEDGTVAIRDAKGAYQDVDPETATTERKVKLDLP